MDLKTAPTHRILQFREIRGCTPKMFMQLFMAVRINTQVNWREKLIEKLTDEKDQRGLQQSTTL